MARNHEMGQTQVERPKLLENGSFGWRRRLTRAIHPSTIHCALTTMHLSSTGMFRYVRHQIYRRQQPLYSSFWYLSNTIYLQFLDNNNCWWNILETYLHYFKTHENFGPIYFSTYLPTLINDMYNYLWTFWFGLFYILKCTYYN